jgi:hypothetical protein
MFPVMLFISSEQWACNLYISPRFPQIIDSNRTSRQSSIRADIQIPKAALTVRLIAEETKHLPILRTSAIMGRVRPASTMATKINKPEAQQHALEIQSNGPPSVGDEGSEWEVHLAVPEPAMQKKEQAKKAEGQLRDTKEAVPSKPMTAKFGEQPFDFSLPEDPPQALLPSIDIRGTGRKPQTVANPARQKKGRTRKPKDHLRIMKRADPKQSMHATFGQRPFQFSQPEEPSRADPTDEEPETEEEEEIPSQERISLDK